MMGHGVSGQEVVSILHLAAVYILSEPQDIPWAMAKLPSNTESGPLVPVSSPGRRGFWGLMDVLLHSSVLGPV